MAGPGGFRALIAHPGFARLWIADTLSNFGSFVFALALQILMIETLAANQVDLGLARAAQWLPSLLLGLFAGVLLDRMSRKRVLVGCGFAGAILLATLAGLAVAGALTMPALLILVFLLGCVAVFRGGAHQSFTADLLPGRLLTSGNVALLQTATLAETLGPLLAGLLIRVIGAPLTIFAHAGTALVSALVLLRMPDAGDDAPQERRRFLEDLREGLGWIYRHPTLAPYALTLHAWFIGNNIAWTIYVFHATAQGLGTVAIGVTLACSGAAGVLGSALAERLSRRFGMGPVCVAGYLFTGMTFAIVALTPPGPLAPVFYCLALASFGFGNGIEGPLTMSYRNAVTPPRLRGRMNTTIRSINWGLIAIAAPFGGWLAFTFGDRVALGVGAAIMTGAGIALGLSRFRNATMPVEHA